MKLLHISIMTDLSASQNSARQIREGVFGVATQAAFAAMLGVKPSTVSRWETSGRISGPRQVKVRALAAKLGKPWSDAWFFN